MKKYGLLILLPVLLFSCRNLTDDDAYTAEYKKTKTVVTAETLTEKLVDVYEIVNGSLKCHSGEEGASLFFTQDGDIPYVETKSFSEYWFAPEITTTKEGYVYKLSPANYPDCYLSIDFSSGEVYSNDWDIIHCDWSAGKVTCTDILYNPTFTKRFPISNIRGANASGSINLNDYNIPLKYEAGYGFIPLQALFTLLTWLIPPAMYNGESLFLDIPYAYMDSKDFCSKAANPKTSWSEEFGEYSYNLLCLAMDMYYGRKDYLGITDFNSWLTNAGLKERLCSTDIETAENALGEMLLANIGDLHTYYYHLTPYAGLDEDGLLKYQPKVSGGLSETRWKNNAYLLQSLLAGNETYYYCESGSTTGFDKEDKLMNIFIPRSIEDDNTDTIFLTFQGFESDQSFEEYYKNWKYTMIGAKGSDDGITFYKSVGGTQALAEDTSITDVDGFIAAVNSNQGNAYGINIKNQKDTILLTVVSNYVIQKLNKKHAETSSNREIKNVVLDISRNGGGLVDDEIAIASWFLGQTDSCIKNTITGSSSCISYIADIDFDGNYNSLNQYAVYERTKDSSDINDSDDTICNLNRYCIISLQSFSCGNMLPSQCAFKNNVKLLGHQSGGGTCAVATIEMPSGTSFATSSPFQFSTLVNGSPVDVDAGIPVDVSINPADFGTQVYNRENFCKNYID